MDKVFTQVAQEAYNTGAPSPHILSSSMDMAYRVGLWCRKNSIYPTNIHESRGYSWKINKVVTLSFKEDSKSPVTV